MRGVAIVVVATFIGWVFSNFLPDLLDPNLSRALRFTALAASLVGAVLWLSLTRKKKSFKFIIISNLLILLFIVSGSIIFNNIARGNPGPEMIIPLHVVTSVIFLSLGALVEATGLKIVDKS